MRYERYSFDSLQKISVENGSPQLHQDQGNESRNKVLLPNALGKKGLQVDSLIWFFCLWPEYPKLMHPRS